MTLEEAKKLKGKKVLLTLSDDEKELFKKDQIEVRIVVASQGLSTVRLPKEITKLGYGHNAADLCKTQNCWFVYLSDLSEIKEGVKT